MNKKNQAPEKSNEDTRDIPVIPFDDALKRMLSAPPDHKVAKPAPKKAKKKTAK